MSTTRASFSVTARTTRWLNSPGDISPGSICSSVTRPSASRCDSPIPIASQRATNVLARSSNR